MISEVQLHYYLVWYLVGLDTGKWQGQAGRSFTEPLRNLVPKPRVLSKSLAYRQNFTHPLSPFSNYSTQLLTSA